MAEEGKSQTYVKTHKAVAAGSPRYSGGLHLQARGGRNSDRHGVDRGGDHSKLRHLQSSADEGFTPHSESPEMVRGRPPYSRFTSPAKRTRNRTQSRPRQTRSWLALPLARHARLPQRVTVPPEA